MNEDVLKYIEVIIENKSYTGIEISNSPKIFERLRSNQLRIPMSVFENIKSENGLIVLTFENNEVICDLINVTETLKAKFLSEYNRGFVK
jgi:hypothetical protein